MPAFTFEKISPPAELEANGSAPVQARRGAFVRLLDRLTSARLQKSEGDIRKIENRKSKRRKTR
jgi:hypothetical protein